TGRARDRIATTPAGEARARSGRRRQGHHGAVVVGGRAGGPAVDPRGTGGHSATPRPGLVHREGEALAGKGDGDRPGRIHGHGTGRARDRIAAATARDRGPSVGRGRQGHHGAVVVDGRAGGPAVDPGGTGGDRAAPIAGLGDREGEALAGKGDGDRPGRNHGHGTGRARERIAAATDRDRAPNVGRV